MTTKESARSTLPRRNGPVAGGTAQRSTSQRGGSRASSASPPALPGFTRVQRLLIGVVVSGAVIIAGIGFAGSYQAVRELAIKKGFGNFAYVFPIGIDAGICVLLALDLL
ncbi:DUF2637 domain-containing protein, partial [Streptomyces sp. NRRL F-5122]|uniref:DUF2637 domain-containing protein n=1 Tax=Streptomyces sp. NRRL F-5122 TaxID=1609098 RepID=UPI000A4173FA